MSIFDTVMLPLLLALAPGEGGPQQGPPAASIAAKIDSRIFANKPEGERASFLVVFREKAELSGAAAIRDRAARRIFVYESLRARAEASQAGVRRRLAAAGVRFHSHYLVNMIQVEGSAALARELAAHPDVAAIERDAPAMLESPRTAQKSGQAAPAGVEPNVQKVRAPEMWSRGFTGQGVVIGIADTGIEWDHPALKNSYRGWNGVSASHDYNWHDAVHDALGTNGCGSNATAPCDDVGHGTGVAGLAVGDGGEGHRIGVAPGARWIGCRNMDSGVGTPSRYTECFEWFLAPTDSSGANPRPELGADLINNSWLCSASEGCTDPAILKDVVEAVRAAGVVVVAAAGNGGNACAGITDAPAIFDASFTIGAVDNNDQSTSFSSRGPVTVDGSNRLKPDLCAPGQGLRTSERGGAYQEFFSGTSAAAPHVAGGIALLWSGVPQLAGDVDATELALESSAYTLTSNEIERLYGTEEERERFCKGLSALTVPNQIFGWGRLDVERAFEMATGAPPQSPCAANPGVVCVDAGRFSEFPVSARGGGPGDIVTGSDGNLWFVSPESPFVGRVTTAGEVTEFAVSEWLYVGPTSLTTGPDGRLWFTQPHLNRIGRISTSGAIDGFSLPPLTAAHGIANGPDGNLWFTTLDDAFNVVPTRITTAGELTSFALPFNLVPFALASGPDGNLWFTEFSGRIARMSPQGVVTGTYAVPMGGWPGAITAGPDGNLWFTESRNKSIGRITTSGVITMFPIPSFSTPSDIAAGPDGNMWFSETDKIGRITRAGAITEYALPNTGALFNPAAITAGPDDSLWFTEWSGSRIGRMALRGPNNCASTATTLCLNDGRFKVAADWTKPDSSSGQATGVPLTADSGYFWFFDPSNIEVVVKVLDGCSQPSHSYWVFAAGLTNLESNLIVTDTATGDVKVYTNHQGTAYQPIQDTVAFPCP